MNLSDNHNQILQRAIKALHERTFFAQYPEHPAPAVYGETADADGMKKYQGMLGKNFTELLQENPKAWGGEEVSPYTMENLGINYPLFDTATLVERGKKGFEQWRKASVSTRAAILIESLERMKKRFFDIAYATMHTTGQGYMMSFQASGPHAADRALEAIAAGYEEITRFPENAFWEKPMGKFSLQINKEWVAVPKGVGLVIGCSTFPTWNTVPGLYADLITGNSCIVKPHPKAVLPIAIVVAEIQNVLKENGFDVNICQLGADVTAHLITKELAEHKDVKLVDFTGNSEFGNYIENLKGKVSFTEKTGVNSVIIDSADDVDGMVQNLAFSVSLYSGQMCTAPQNFYIPEGGVKTPNGVVSFDEVAAKFTAAVKGLYENPKAGPFVLGAIQNQATCDRAMGSASLNAKLLLAPGSLANPQFANARTVTPAVYEVSVSDKATYAKELFGPIVLLIKTKNTQQSADIAAEMAMEHGAISCAAYSTDASVKEMIKDKMGMAYTAVSFNLYGGIYVNQNAAFSDYHVTGGNPAGNASFTNPEYVIKRFTWVGFREPKKA